MKVIIDYFKNLTIDKFLHIFTRWYGILFLICLLVLTSFLISIIVTSRLKTKNQMMNKNLNIVRLFSIHYKENYVYAIDKFNLKRKRKENLKWFLDSFIPKDRHRVEVWLNELQKEDHRVPHHLELYIKVKSFKQPVFSVISVSSINYEEGIIHLESRVFPNIRKVNRVKHKQKTGFVIHYKDIPEVVQKHQNSPKNVFLIRLFSTNELDDLSRVNHIITTLIVSRLVKYCSETRYICSLGSNEIVLIDFKLTTKNEAYALSHTLSNEISKILFLSSIYEDYGYKIGIVQTKEVETNLSNEIKLAREVSIYAAEDENDSTSIIYDENTSYKTNKQDAIIKDIKNLMDRRLFSCNYTPILNTYDGSIFGYSCEVFAPNALITSIENMQEYAAHNNFLSSLNRILYIETNQAFNFNTNLNRFVYTTMELKPSQYLSFIDVYTHTETPSHVKTIFIITDEDIVDDQQKSLQIIKELKKVEMCLGLKITSTNLDLIPEIMKSFDFFFLSEESFKRVYESQNQILYGDMISRLNFYSAQIISLNISTWPLIDFYCKYSIKHISSPLFSTGTKQLPEIDSKKLSKFNNICRHYERNR